MAVKCEIINIASDSVIDLAQKTHCVSLLCIQKFVIFICFKGFNGLNFDWPIIDKKTITFSQICFIFGIIIEITILWMLGKRKRLIETLLLFSHRSYENLYIFDFFLFILLLFSQIVTEKIRNLQIPNINENIHSWHTHTYTNVTPLIKTIHAVLILNRNFTFVFMFGIRIRKLPNISDCLTYYFFFTMYCVIHFVAHENVYLGLFK